MTWFVVLQDPLIRFNHAVRQSGHLTVVNHGHPNLKAFSDAPCGEDRRQVLEEAGRATFNSRDDTLMLFFPGSKHSHPTSTLLPEERCGLRCMALWPSVLKNCLS